jgi:N4-gp56 family major capsid protein
MARTIVGLNDPKAVKKFSAILANDVARDSYFQSRFMGRGESASTPIQMLSDLEADAGDQISYDLSVQLKMAPIEGDDILEGNEEPLKFYTDTVYVDQVRSGVNTGGRMTRKRTLHDMRKIARRRQGDWWQRFFDECFFIYLSGARGVNTEFVTPVGWTGRANNSLSAPDSSHIAYAGAATSKGTITSSTKLSLSDVDKLIAKAKMMGGGSVELPRIQPIKIDGENHFVLVMSPYQEYDVRTSSTTGQWLDIQKAATTAIGKDSPIFKGGLGLYNNVVLHVHDAIIRFSDYGSGNNLPANRALFLGAQAAVCAFGTPGGNGSGLRFDWREDEADRGNQVIISTSSIFGIKKTTYNSLDFGVIAVDTYAIDP